MFLTSLCVSLPLPFLSQVKHISSGEGLKKQNKTGSSPSFFRRYSNSVIFFSKASFKLQLEQILFLKMLSFVPNEYDKPTACCTHGD